MQDLTWKYFRDRLVKERDRLATPIPAIAKLVAKVHPELLPQWFVEQNDDTRTRVREAVAKFVATKKWPTNLTTVEQAFVIMRLDWGASQADALMTLPGLPPPSMDTPEEHVMSWFLLNSWERAGAEQTKVGLVLSFECLEALLAAANAEEQVAEEAVEESAA